VREGDAGGACDAGEHVRPDMARQKLLGLELIRFFSALSVLVWHYQHFYYLGDKPPDDLNVEAQPFYGLLAPFYQAGYYGVNLFWCISGFIFYWKYRNSLSERRIGARKFFVLRFSRLYPLHLATLMLVALLQFFYFKMNQTYFVYPGNDAYHFVLQLFFASNWGFQENLSFNGPIWSISVEVLIYLSFFCGMRYFGASPWLALAAFVAAAVGKIADPFSAIADCAGFFYLGGLTCLSHHFISRSAQVRIARSCALLLLLTILATAMAFHLFAVRHFSYLFWLVAAPLLLFVSSGDLLLTPRLRKLVEALGNMTYSSYLAHFPIQLSIAIFFSSREMQIPVSANGLFALYLGASLALSYPIYLLFELPAQKAIRRRFL
jgi:peptidoglycan/LPS O-acetylase OafA/YrhL